MWKASQKISTYNSGKLNIINEKHEKHLILYIEPIIKYAFSPSVNPVSQCVPNAWMGTGHGAYRENGTFRKKRHKRKVP